MLSCLVGTSANAWSEAPQAAAWKTRELTFNYVGFTTHYSCEGLRDKVEQALITLGARPDLTVTTGACAGEGRPERFPSVRIKVSTLTTGAAPASGDSVEANWKTVSLGGISKLSPGDCELAEQIRSEILPLFTTRNLKEHVTCVPHQEPAGNIDFTVDVLVPAQQ
jgi:hypothetical protein